MKYKMKKFAAFCVILSLCISTTIAFAAAPELIEPTEISLKRASDYLSSYSSWLGVGSSKSGTVYVYYDVDATRTMDKVGITHVAIQYQNGSSWITEKSIIGAVSNGMIRENYHGHYGTVTFNGTSGKTYRAVITFYAALGDGSDSRTLTTASIVAP